MHREGSARRGGQAVVGLEMRAECEKCEAPLGPMSAAFICSFECTFCPHCSHEMDDRCPNCGGELVRRPKRRPKG